MHRQPQRYGNRLAGSRRGSSGGRRSGDFLCASSTRRGADEIMTGMRVLRSPSFGKLLSQPLRRPAGHPPPDSSRLRSRAPAHAQSAGLGGGGCAAAQADATSRQTPGLARTSAAAVDAAPTARCQSTAKPRALTPNFARTRRPSIEDQCVSGVVASRVGDGKVSKTVSVYVCD